MFSISLNPDFPVVDYSIKKEYWNKNMFTTYINNKSVPYDQNYPEMNPVEQAFNYLKQYVHTQAIKLQLKDGWKENQLKLAIEEGIKTITHERVKSWYRGSYIFMYPRLKIPKYMKSTNKLK